MLLKFALQDFLEDREYKNIATTTIVSYQNALNPFVDYCTSQSVMNVQEITNQTVKRYIIHCQKEKGHNATTTNSNLKRIKAFLNYMVEIEVIKSNPANVIKQSREDIRIEVFSDYHIKQMLNYYRRIKRREQSFFAYRDYSMIVTFLSSGCRLSEIVRLKWSDINFQQNTMSIFGKSRKYETIPVTEKLVKELSAYKVYCEQFFGKDQLNEYIFTNRLNKQLSENAVQNTFKRLSKIMNFRDVRLSAGTFRHTFCQRCIQAGMSTFAVQKMMRHSSIAVTERYSAMWGNDLKEQNDKYNPINNLNI